jgi:hypothetical protein
MLSEGCLLAKEESPLSTEVVDGIIFCLHLETSYYESDVE